MSRSPRASGRDWEIVAARHLRDHGLMVVELGYQCRLGELDLVCLDDTTLVIVEVRARSSRARGTALESVDLHKRRKIITATRHFLMRRPEWFHRPLRFDVVAIDDIDTANPHLRWVRNAFHDG